MTFLKTKRSLELVALSFSAWFLKKTYFFCYIILTNQISLSPHEILDNNCIVVVCFPRCLVINFKINLSFFINQPHNQKTQYKNLNIWRTKRAFIDEKHFPIIFKGLSLKKIKQIFWKVRA